ncbi:multiprotein-bridging factor 1 family protein [Amycolatopsis halotolerans]|uniref:Multiprotein-bridging factor 1 family protein n=1 Tax=Amycolatopsis halotolerans TaxID=330083 RepID=A0ABV7QNB5_9PSEU
MQTRPVAGEQGPPPNMLGSALRAARETRKWGVRELARRIGVNPSMLSSWEFGQRPPKMLDVAAILGALGVIGDEKQRILYLACAAELDRFASYLMALDS